MAIAVTHLATLSTGTNATSYAFGSVTPTVNSLVVLFASTTLNSTPATATLSDTQSHTWTSLANFHYVTSGTHGRMQAWATQANGSAFVATVNYGSTMASGEGFIVQATGTDVVGGVAQTIVQTVTTTADSTGSGGTVTLSSAASTDNRPLAYWAHFAAEGTTEDTSWTELGDANHASPDMGTQIQWRSDAFDTSAAATWATSSLYGGIAMEIKAGTGFTPKVIMVL